MTATPPIKHDKVIKNMSAVSEPLIPVFYLHQLYQQLCDWQLPAQQWLQQNKLTLADLQQANNQLTLSQYSELIDSAITLSQRPDIGLYVGKKISVIAHGMLGLAMLNSASLNDALLLLKQFIHTRNPLIEIDISAHHQKLHINFDLSQPLPKGHQAFIDAITVTFLTLFLHLLTDKSVIKMVHLKVTKPDYYEQYSLFIPCELLFSQPQNSIVLSQTTANQRLASSDPAAAFQAKQFCQQQLDAQQPVGFVIQVQQLILKHQGKISQQNIAQRLHLSPRTLHRQLLKHHTSYQQLLTNVQQHLAQHYLRESNMSIKQIAFELGYVDVANFRRAFKRWYQITPQDFRKNPPLRRV